MQRGYDLRSYLEFHMFVNWLIRLLYSQADRELASNGKSPEKLKGAGSFLMKVFGVLAVCFFVQTIYNVIFRIVTSDLRIFLAYIKFVDCILGKRP